MRDGRGAVAVLAKDHELDSVAVLVLGNDVALEPARFIQNAGRDACGRCLGRAHEQLQARRAEVELRGLEEELAVVDDHGVRAARAGLRAS